MTTLRELEKAATEGPWERLEGFTYTIGRRHTVRARVLGGERSAVLLQMSPNALDPADAAFIAAFRNVAPQLLDVVDAAREVSADDVSGRLHRALVALDAKAPK